MSTRDDERAARLKAALRDNLRRRKAQARGRADTPGGVQGEPVPPAPGDAPRSPDPES